MRLIITRLPILYKGVIEMQLHSYLNVYK